MLGAKMIKEGVNLESIDSASYVKITRNDPGVSQPKLLFYPDFLGSDSPSYQSLRMVRTLGWSGSPMAFR